MPHLYENHMMQQYKGAGFGDLSPHPFAVADAAYRFESFTLGVIISIVFQVRNPIFYKIETAKINLV